MSVFGWLADNWSVLAFSAGTITFVLLTRHETTKYLRAEDERHAREDARRYGDGTSPESRRVAALESRDGE